MAIKPDIADTIFSAFVARRERLRHGRGRACRTDRRLAVLARGDGAARVRGAIPRAAHVDRCRGRGRRRRPARRHGIPAARHAGGDHARPACCAIRHPGEFAAHLGLTFHAQPGFIFDLVVVGSGPAGLSAAVYGASEGLSTVSLDAVSTGGQAGASSRIENYVGFPNGISGEELASARGDPGATARRALERAVRGRRAARRGRLPGDRARGRQRDPVPHGDRRVRGSLPTARRRRPRTLRRRRRLLRGDRPRGADLHRSPVIVVGGGNSAGQAAIYLVAAGQSGVDRDPGRRPRPQHVALPHRADRSRPAHRGVDHAPRCAPLEGDGHLDHVTLEHTPTGERRRVGCSGLFCFIGADPATGVAARRAGARREGIHPHRPLPARCGHQRPAVRDARPAAARDVGPRRVRGR